MDCSPDFQWFQAISGKLTHSATCVQTLYPEIIQDVTSHSFIFGCWLEEKPAHWISTSNSILSSKFNNCSSNCCSRWGSLLPYSLSICATWEKNYSSSKLWKRAILRLNLCLNHQEIHFKVPPEQLDEGILVTISMLINPRKTLNLESYSLIRSHESWLVQVIPW